MSLERLESTPSSKRGRPAQNLLWPEKIAQSALELIDDHGADALTMKALAKRLGVKAPSIYHHVASKTELIELVRSLIVAEMRFDHFSSMPWDEALVVFARSYRQAFAKHPNTVMLLATTPIDSTITYKMYESVIFGLVDQGWASARALDILLGLEYLVLGSVMDYTAEEVMWDPAMARRHGATAFAECLPEAPDQRGVATRAFEELLELFIKSLRAERVN